MTLDPEHLQDDRITRIETKLDALIVSVAKSHCPAPGTCMMLMPRIDKVEIAHVEMSRRLASLERWQAGLMAVIACLGFFVMPILVVFGPAIRIKLGLP